MPEQTTDTTDTTTGTETATDATSGDATDAGATTETTATEDAKSDGADDLGDKGKKALDAMKAKWKAAEEKARSEAAERAALQAKLDGKEAEYAEEQKARAAEAAALAKADERILKAEVRASAAAKLADPTDALRFIDLSEFEVGSDGEVDSSAIAQAIDDLIASKPYLAAQGGGRFQGGADAGARNDANKVSQLTQRDMDGMSPEQIDEAHQAGRFDNLMGVVK